MRFMLFIPLVILVGCGSTPTEQTDTGGVIPVDKSVTASTEIEAHEATVAQYNETVSYYKNKVVCTRQRVTGSHFKVRICRTVAQIEREREEAQRDAANAASVSGSRGQ